MSRISTLLLVGVIACSTDGSGLVPDPVPGPGDFSRSVESGGRSRSYLLHVPPAAESEARLPLIIAFHGIPSNAAEMRALTGFNAVADERGIVIAYPNAIDDWATGCVPCSITTRLRIDDVQFTRDLIERISADTPIDRARVFAAGFSNGALFIHRLACDETDRIAGFASIGATLIDDEFVPPCDPQHQRPMIFFHGSEDTSFPRQGRIFELDLGTVSTLAMEESVALWAGRNGCSSDPSIVPLADVTDDGTTVIRHDFASCVGGANVEYYDIQGGGHTWPGAPVDFAKFLGVKSRDIIASELIADHFGIQ